MPNPKDHIPPAMVDTLNIENERLKSKIIQLERENSKLRKDNEEKKSKSTQLEQENANLKALLENGASAQKIPDMSRSSKELIIRQKKVKLEHMK